MAKPYPAFDESDEIGRLLNEIVSAAISREIRQVIGGQLIDGPNGRVLRVGASEAERRKQLYRIIIPAGGIAANTSASVNYYGSSHTDSGLTITAWNRLSTTIGGVSAVDGWAAWNAEENEYQVIQRVGCP
jgi:hypothetical protein